MLPIPLRLLPGDDLRRALEMKAQEAGLEAAFVLQGVGSLSAAALRLAGQDKPVGLNHDLEIITLAGSVSTNGAHLHMLVSDATGAVTAGHIGYGCIVRTTAEILLTHLVGLRFTRQHDSATGYAELAIQSTSLLAGRPLC